ncbi:DNA photolyase 1 [Chrysodeixis chalcites nucleopolyhedrovirus]|uniref:DNA photolyase 1 n=3 Tax=Alphabaculovirus TaxID=558016 RepID=Q4KT12_9ABAC|nr:DNA photolyase 1 [Chrysodeixis chalcites nucleopolyhedrovirus]AAY83999.1 DNA photolyase 1 [Chrysodeixis chalcites nucleopolyhedrovirus]AGE61329.1 DNA photolyase 1 [Chrysodeixis chalcites nucleopolyhedrovirus]AGE61628.1 DNA photolyase 1 [Chrysodeixis chalcites nucleopolyhedrovirus]
MSLKVNYDQTFAVSAQQTLANHFQECRTTNIGRLCDPKRILKLNQTEEPDHDVVKKGGVVYWMWRDCRVQDNWAMIYAQYLAFKTKSPLYIVYCLPKFYLNSTRRQYQFLIEGLIELSEECAELDITFVILDDSADVVLIDWVRKHDICAVVCDFNPLQLQIKSTVNILQNLPADVYFAQVDAHNVVPCWLTFIADRHDYDEFKSKIDAELENLLTPFSLVIQHPYKSVVSIESSTNTSIDWSNLLSSRNVDHSVKRIKWTEAGYNAAILRLATFIQCYIYNYKNSIHNPVSSKQSDLSPFFHFGFISAQRVIYHLRFCVTKKSVLQKTVFIRKLKNNIEKFIENCLYRREFADNFCYFNLNYITFNAASPQIKRYIAKHLRYYTYSLNELEYSQTHDNIWNKAQEDLRENGKIYPFIRVYWAKKILEWTSTPEEALNRAIYLNQKYAVDGCDPSGYVGCLYAMSGLLNAGQSNVFVFGEINNIRSKWLINTCKYKDFTYSYTSFRFQYMFE